MLLLGLEEFIARRLASKNQVLLFKNMRAQMERDIWISNSGYEGMSSIFQASKVA